MITIMKTKTFLNALDDSYAKGVVAGGQAEALKEKEDQNRRLHEMYHYGKAAGLVDAYTTEEITDVDGTIDLSDLMNEAKA